MEGRESPILYTARAMRTGTGFSDTFRVGHIYLSVSTEFLQNIYPPQLKE
jgi:hypothetical protein